MHRHEVGSPQPQGSSLLPELCCLEPSSLNRPHPPHSWAHRIFTAWRLIRDAFAVRERLGDPRVVPGFRYPFCPGIPSSPTPGSSIIVSSSAAMSTRPSPRVDRLGTPRNSRNPFHAGDDFRGFLVHTSATVCQLARPLHGSDRLPSQRGFYIRAFSGLVALPAAGYNYNSDWTPLLAGLSPARMAASLAAPTPSS